MFNIGDKIIYPEQGIGTINSIEKKQFKGKMQNHYIVNLLNNSMKLMVPASSAELLHMRLVSNSNDIDNTLKNMNEFKVEGSELLKLNFKERNMINSKKLKSGTLTDYVEVVCNLTQLKNEHSLNSTDKNMLRNTKIILIDEIREAKNLSDNEAQDMLNMAIKFQ